MSLRVAAGIVKRGTVVPPATIIELNRESLQGTLGQWRSPGVLDPRTAWRITTDGPTPTASTGPGGGANPTTRAVTAADGYAFTESSEPAATDGPWSLESPAFDASQGTLELLFDLHQNFGNGAITDGTLTVQGWNGSAWSAIGNAITGSQQSSPTAPWRPSTDFGVYDSTGFSNSDFRWRFLATRGVHADQFNYDFALDNLVIKGPPEAQQPRTDFDFETGVRRLHVAKDGADPLDGQTPDLEFTTIQAALDAALPGDVISIADGVYYEVLSLTGKAGTPALPIWIVAENRGGAVVSNAIPGAQQATATWQAEGGGIYSLAVAARPFAAWIGDTMLPQWTLADLSASTFQAEANTQTGFAAASFTKPNLGYAFDAGRVRVRLPDASNPNGQAVAVTNGSSQVLLTLTGSPYVIVDGLTFEGSGHTYAVNAATGSSNATVRNCVFKGCRHGVRCGAAATLVEWNEFIGVPGMEQFGKDLRALNGAGSDVHARYHDDYNFGLKFGFNTERFSPVLDGSIDIPSVPANTGVEVVFNLVRDAYAATRIAQHAGGAFLSNVCRGLVGPAVRTAALANDLAGDLRIASNRFLDCQRPLVHTGLSKFKRHLVYRNLVLNLDTEVARPPYLIDVRNLGTGAEVHYYQNTFINRIGGQDGYGSFGTGHRVFFGSPSSLPPPPPPPPPPTGLISDEIIVPSGFAMANLAYDNRFLTINIDSAYGTNMGNPAAPLALNDSWKTWNVVALDGNSEKGIKACLPGITHAKGTEGIILRTAAYDPNAQIAQWIKDSYGQDSRATHAAMISTEHKATITNGVFQCMVRKTHHEDGDHTSLWMLAEDGGYPPEIDIFEQVRGDTMGNGLSINVHGAGGDVFQRFPSITLDDWTLIETRITPSTISFAYNGTVVKTASNPYPNRVLYPLFTFECNGNWPTSVGRSTSYTGQGSVYEFAYWRMWK